jgi:hypothetical protein
LLTNMNFLNIGAPWPPPSELERVTLYKQNRDLFEGKHDKVFKDWIRLLRDDQQATLEVILNWPKRLTTLFADLLLGEPPQIEAGDEGSQEQEVVTRIIEDNNLFNTAYEVALDVSRFGVGLFKIRHDERAIVEAQTPLVWFPVVQPDNVKDVSAHVLGWDYEAEEQTIWGARMQRYLKLEIHEKGRITTRLHKLAAGNIAGLVEESIVQTGVDDFLVVPVFNLSTSDRLTGLDDYSDLDSIVQELEIRMAQISRILDKHADPNMCGPDSALEQDPQSGQWTFRGGGKYFPVGQGEQAPAYVTWEGQLDAAFKELDVLMEQFYTLSETSAAAFGQLKAGLAESGSALRRLMMAPLAKTNRIRLRFDPAMRNVLMLASELEVVQGARDAVKLEEIHITWQDGLPDDDMEETQIEATRYSAGLTSLESALMRLDGLEGEALQAEIDRIKAERAGSYEASAIELPELEAGGEE